MRVAILGCTWMICVVLATPALADPERSVEVPISENGEVRIDQIVTRLADATGVRNIPLAAPLALSTLGLARGLTSTFLAKMLGPDVTISLEPRAIRFSFDPRVLTGDRRDDWVKRLNDLGQQTLEASRRKLGSGMRALPSYRANDPDRPTICLVHGLNSSSGGFVHMLPWLEQAGYGIIVYDYPFNRKLEDSCNGFARDWAAFRGRTGDKLPWAIVAHSMGCLLARSLVENDATWGRDVTSLALIAPVNQGSELARVQTMIQLLTGVQALNDKNSTKTMLHLSDGLGQAARDMLPGSPFLTSLNRRPRRAGVSYHILAGDRGVLNRDGRAQIEARLAMLTRNAGIFGKLTQTATADFPDILDELTDGTGDGCVALERTRLEGVADWSVIHANHAELVRAPLLFSEPGPVACMPALLDWLKSDRDHNAR